MTEGLDKDVITRAIVDIANKTTNLYALEVAYGISLNRALVNVEFIHFNN